MKRNVFALLFCICAVVKVEAKQNESLKIWFNRPAQKWDAGALPIGNGRMGAMLFGGVEKERIQFNEQSLWSGDNNFKMRGQPEAWIFLPASIPPISA